MERVPSFVPIKGTLSSRNAFLPNTANILAKKSSIFEAKRYCARPFLVITFHAAAHETVLPSIPYTFSSRSYTGQRLRLAVPALPASSFIVFVISVIDIHVSGDVRCSVFIRRRADRKKTFYLLSRLLQCCSRPYYIIYLYYNL